MKNLWPLLLILMLSLGTNGQTDVRRFFNTPGNTDLLATTNLGRGFTGADSFQPFAPRVQLTSGQQTQRFAAQPRGRVSSVTVPVIDLGTGQQQSGQGQQTTVIRQTSRGQISPLGAGQPVAVGGFPTNPFGPTLVGPTETGFPFARGSPFGAMTGPTLLGPNMNGMRLGESEQMLVLPNGIVDSLMTMRNGNRRTLSRMSSASGAPRTLISTFSALPGVFSNLLSESDSRLTRTAVAPSRPGVPPPQINFPQRLPPQAISDMQAAAAQQSFGTPAQFGVMQTQSVGRPGSNAPGSAMPFPGMLPPGPTLGQGPVAGLPPTGRPFNFPFGTPIPPQSFGNAAGTFVAQQGIQRQATPVGQRQATQGGQRQATQGTQRQATPGAQRQATQGGQRQATQSQTQRTVQSTRVNQLRPQGVQNQASQTNPIPQFNQPPQIIPAAGMPPQFPMQGPGFGPPFMPPPGFRPFAGQPFGFAGPNMRPMPPRFPGMNIATQAGQQQPGLPQAAGAASSQATAANTRTAQMNTAQGARQQVPQARPFMPNMQALPRRVPPFGMGGLTSGMAQAGGNPFVGFPSMMQGSSPGAIAQSGPNQPPQMMPGASNNMPPMMPGATNGMPPMMPGAQNGMPPMMPGAQNGMPPMMPPGGTQFAGMPPSGAQFAGMPQPPVNSMNTGPQAGIPSFGATSSQTNTAGSGLSRTNRQPMPQRPNSRNMPGPIIPHTLPRGLMPQPPQQRPGQTDPRRAVPTPQPHNHRQPFMGPLPRRVPPFGMGAASDAARVSSTNVIIGPQPPMPGAFPQPSGQQNPMFSPPNMGPPGAGNGGPLPGLFGGPIPAFPDLQTPEKSVTEAAASDASNSMSSMPNNEPPNSRDIPNNNNEAPPRGNNQPTDTLPGFPTMIFAGPFAGGSLDANPVDSSPPRNNEPPISNSPLSGRNEPPPDNDRPPSLSFGVDTIPTPLPPPPPVMPFTEVPTSAQLGIVPPVLSSSSRTNSVFSDTGSIGVFPAGGASDTLNVIDPNAGGSFSSIVRSSEVIAPSILTTEIRSTNISEVVDQQSRSTIPGTTLTKNNILRIIEAMRQGSKLTTQEINYAKEALGLPMNSTVEEILSSGNVTVEQLRNVTVSQNVILGKRANTPNINIGIVQDVTITRTSDTAASSENSSPSATIGDSSNTIRRAKMPPKTLKLKDVLRIIEAIKLGLQLSFRELNFAKTALGLPPNSTEEDILTSENITIIKQKLGAATETSNSGASDVVNTMSFNVSPISEIIVTESSNRNVPSGKPLPDTFIDESSNTVTGTVVDSLNTGIAQDLSIAETSRSISEIEQPVVGTSARAKMPPTTLTEEDVLLIIERLQQNSQVSYKEIDYAKRILGLPVTSTIPEMLSSDNLRLFKERSASANLSGSAVGNVVDSLTTATAQDLSIADTSRSISEIEQPVVGSSSSMASGGPRGKMPPTTLTEEDVLLIIERLQQNYQVSYKEIDYAKTILGLPVTSTIPEMLSSDNLRLFKEKSASANLSWSAVGNVVDSLNTATAQDLSIAETSRSISEIEQPVVGSSSSMAPGGPRGKMPPTTLTEEDVLLIIERLQQNSQVSYKEIDYAKRILGLPVTSTIPEMLSSDNLRLFKERSASANLSGSAVGNVVDSLNTATAQDLSIAETSRSISEIEQPVVGSSSSMAPGGPRGKMAPTTLTEDDVLLIIERLQQNYQVSYKEIDYAKRILGLPVTSTIPEMLSSDNLRLFKERSASANLSGSAVGNVVDSLNTETAQDLSIAETSRSISEIEQPVVGSSSSMAPGGPRGKMPPTTLTEEDVLLIIERLQQNSQVSYKEIDYAKRILGLPVTSTIPEMLSSDNLRLFKERSASANLSGSAVGNVVDSLNTATAQDLSIAETSRSISEIEQPVVGSSNSMAPGGLRGKMPPTTLTEEDVLLIIERLQQNSQVSYKEIDYAKRILGLPVTSTIPEMLSSDNLRLFKERSAAANLSGSAVGNVVDSLTTATTQDLSIAETSRSISEIEQPVVGSSSSMAPGGPRGKMPPTTLTEEDVLLIIERLQQNYQVSYKEIDYAKRILGLPVTSTIPEMLSSDNLRLFKERSASANPSGSAAGNVVDSLDTGTAQDLPIAEISRSISGIGQPVVGSSAGVFTSSVNILPSESELTFPTIPLPDTPGIKAPAESLLFENIQSNGIDSEPSFATVNTGQFGSQSGSTFDSITVNEIDVVPGVSHIESIKTARTSDVEINNNGVSEQGISQTDTVRGGSSAVASFDAGSSIQGIQNSNTETVSDVGLSRVVLHDQNISQEVRNIASSDPIVTGQSSSQGMGNVVSSTVVSGGSSSLLNNVIMSDLATSEQGAHNNTNNVVTTNIKVTEQSTSTDTTSAGDVKNSQLVDVLFGGNMIDQIIENTNQAGGVSNGQPTEKNKSHQSSITEKQNTLSASSSGTDSSHINAAENKMAGTLKKVITNLRIVSSQPGNNITEGETSNKVVSLKNLLSDAKSTISSIGSSSGGLENESLNAGASLSVVDNNVGDVGTSSQDSRNVITTRTVIKTRTVTTSDGEVLGDVPIVGAQDGSTIMENSNSFLMMGETDTRQDKLVDTAAGTLQGNAFANNNVQPVVNPVLGPGLKTPVLAQTQDLDPSMERTSNPDVSVSVASGSKTADQNTNSSGSNTLIANQSTSSADSTINTSSHDTSGNKVKTSSRGTSEALPPRPPSAAIASSSPADAFPFLAA